MADGTNSGRTALQSARQVSLIMHSFFAQAPYLFRMKKARPPRPNITLELPETETALVCPLPALIRFQVRNAQNRDGETNLPVDALSLFPVP